MKRILTTAILLALLAVPATPAGDAQRNAADSQRAVRLCKRLVHGWLDQADPKTGLIPRNLKKDWFWNSRDAAADNFPFFLLTAFITDEYYLKKDTLAMLEQEQRLTNRLDRLPDDFLFDRQGFRDGDYKLDDLIFGASEYAKDGLIPITEWLGPGPWLSRMQGLIEDIWKHAPVDSRFGKLPSRGVEVNGNMLQVCSRLYWLTGEDRYREWVFRLADHYFLDEDILKKDSLQLDDHSCEIIGGLSEAYVVAAQTDPRRRKLYRPHMHAILDTVLRYGRNKDGLLYEKVNPETGEILSQELTDNWGYNYNAVLTVAKIDGVERYRAAVVKVLGNIHKYVDYQWEGNGADGFADSIEGGINLLNRLPDESARRWVDLSMDNLLSRQDEDGIIEAWHGDGNTARTALMWALWKTQGVTAAPWRNDIQLGAVPLEGGGVRVYVHAQYPWRGRLRFDRPRHRDYFHLPFDYPRINQFPEWFTVEQGTKYTVAGAGAPATVDGARLRSYPLLLGENAEVTLTVRPAR